MITANIDFARPEQAYNYAYMNIGFLIRVLKPEDEIPANAPKCIEDQDFVQDLNGFLELRCKEFYEFVRRLYPGRRVVSKKQLCDDAVIAKFIDDLFIKYNAAKAYRESRPDLYD